MNKKFSKLYLSFKDNFKELLKLKKPILIYFGFLVFTVFCIFSVENYLNPFKELFVMFIAFILGIISISYYTKNKKKLHRVAFVIIILFGILSLFTAPLFNIPDEEEHYVRADTLSQGQIFPIYNHELKGFEISQAQYDFININFKNITNNETGEYSIEFDSHKTIFDTDLGSKKINESVMITHSAFAQNPFYGYIAQAIGILIAKLLDLSVIWTMWLGRFFNLLLYAGISSLAIKKSPIFKIPLLVVACMPLGIYQGASFSIDGFIFCMSLLVVAYFFKMYKSQDKTITKKNIVIFTVLIGLLGIAKLPLMGLALLILFIPKSKFKIKNNYYLGFLSIGILSIIAILWSKLYAVDALSMSWRANYIYLNNVNGAAQIANMLENPLQSAVMILNLPNELFIIPTDIFLPNGANLDINFIIMGVLYTFFLISIFLFYPNNTKIKLNHRIGALLTSIIIFVGTCLIQYITWSPVGLFSVLGISLRYFIPLFSLMPFIFNINIINKEKNLDLIIITLVVSFIGSFLSLVAISYY